MADVVERQHLGLNDLLDFARRFIDCNRHASNVDFRWLSHVLEAEIVSVLCDLGNCKVAPITREKINAFRAEEIREELRRKQRDVEILERDLKSLTKKVA